MTKGGPLRDCRVLELGSMVAGPFCARLFADFGAEVIKVEPPDGDAVRSFAERYQGKSLYWASVARGKRAIAVNLKTEAGREIIRQLMATCDVVVENYRPGQLEEWGLGYDDVAKLHPRLVMVRISGFGQTGPYRERPGFGIVGEALSGLRSLIGDPDRPPTRAATPLTDYVAAVYAAFGTMLALYDRDRTGRGQCVDATLIESAFSMMEGFVPAFDKLGRIANRVGTRLPGHAPNNLYPTGDDDWIQIAAGNTSTFRRLAKAMEREDLARDPRFADATERNQNDAALDAIITAWTESHDRDWLYKTLVAHEVPAAPIYTVADIFKDPHYQARDMLVQAPDGELGPVTVTGVVPKLSESPGEVRWAGRPLGADTAAVLTELLGLNGADIARLEASGAIVCARAPTPARAAAPGE
jgi:crotonobetainyl-CoA:carnitine CoA-transferase CaiB-like acyl-CoA transferase